MNYGQLLELAIASSAQQNLVTTFQDAVLLNKVIDASKKAGGFNPKVMAKDGSLQPVVAAAARTFALLDKMLSDKTQGPIALAFVESI